MRQISERPRFHDHPARKQVGPLWINATGCRAPWVLIEIWPGRQDNLHLLGAAAPPDQPLLGFSPPAPDTVASWWRINEFADYYLRWIRSLETAAPLLLVGWSINGVLVAEIARRASAQVAGVVLIDTWMVRSLHPAAALLRAQTAISSRGDRTLLEATIAHLKREKRMQRQAWGKRKDWLRRMAQGDRVTDPTDLTHRALSLAALAYRPRRLATPASFITASETIRRQGLDCSVQWRPYLRRVIEHRVVEGDHYSLWEPDALAEIVEVLRRTGEAVT